MNPGWRAFGILSTQLLWHFVPSCTEGLEGLEASGEGVGLYRNLLSLGLRLAMVLGSTLFSPGAVGATHCPVALPRSAASQPFFATFARVSFLLESVTGKPWGAVGTPECWKLLATWKSEQHRPLTGGLVPLGHLAGAGHVEPGAQMAERSLSWLETRPPTGHVERGAPRGPPWDSTRSPWLELRSCSSASTAQVTGGRDAAAWQRSQHPLHQGLRSQTVQTAP